MKYELAKLECRRETEDGRGGRVLYFRVRGPDTSLPPSPQPPLAEEVPPDEWLTSFHKKKLAH